LLAPLALLDAADFDTGLSPENARHAWSVALRCASCADLDRPLPGTTPAAVAIIASANVFTAPLEWCFQLVARGVRVVLKAASAQAGAAAAIGQLPGVDVRRWTGGELADEARALAGVDAAIVFGGHPTIEAIRARAPVPVLGLGPRFGIAWAPRVDAAAAAGLARDLAAYDSRGCMSPAALFTGPLPPFDTLAEAMAEAERRWPRGRISDAEAAELRRLGMLARATGSWIEGAGWAVAGIPAARFSPVALPRALVVHAVEGAAPIESALAPWLGELGTIGVGPGAPPIPLLAGHAARSAALGTMQAPPGDRPSHDGIDVLAWAWGRR
jgi:hypothetical protein